MNAHDERTAADRREKSLPGQAEFWVSTMPVLAGARVEAWQITVFTRDSKVVADGWLIDAPSNGNTALAQVDASLAAHQWARVRPWEMGKSHGFVAWTSPRFDF